jgi:hypothetical protein
MDNEESRRSEDVISDLLVDQKFDLINLFNRLMETKSKVYREEKADAANANQIMEDAINDLIQDIQVTLQIWPSKQSSQIRSC